ncbi:glycoside hydrolase family 35 protein [Ceratobasidium sp. AG-I]|nr:glycoside hydrolase family 35 protein [Ceratobasidium sp. AG-I]
MRLLKSLGLVLGLASTVVWGQTNTTQWPVHDTGLSKVVQWDHYSLIINGQRLFIWSGEFHYWRIPVREVWRDILEKVKAAGFNTVSVYGNWGYHSASPGVVDFESGAHNFESILTDCKDLGLYVIWRAGPYVNAETTAGGFALWATTGAYGTLRNNDTRYTEAWLPYMERYTSILSKHQVTNGGNLVLFQLENEFWGQRTNSGAENWPLIAYMQRLEKTSRDAGLVIPFFTNAPNMGSKSWSKDYDVNGAQDIYGVDSYPSCWSCNLNECGNVKPFTVVNYHDHFNEVSPTQPSFIPEFQGGSYNPWGGPQGGCLSNMGPDFANVFYRHNVAERVSMVSLYTVYGGTSWGGLPFSMSGTSYDYSAAISESRQVGQKYYETKLFGMFIRAASELTKVDRIANSTSYTTNSLISATELRNPDTKAGFYVTLHAASDAETSDTFKMHVSTSRGNLTVPTKGAINLNGRESKIIVTDFSFGNKTLLYSTSEVLSHATIDNYELLALWLPQGESGEFVIKGGSATHKVLSGPAATFTTTNSSDLLVSYSQTDAITIVQFDGFKALLVPRTTAWKFWAPSFSTNPRAPADSLVFVTGPYLVRGASLAKGSSLLEITGDADAATPVEIFAPKQVTALSWNGKKLSGTRTAYGSWKATTPALDLTGAGVSASLAKTLASGWKVADGLPERWANYSDAGAGWVLANHTTTPNPTKPSTLPVLYADEYGFHLGNILWRGRFNGSASGVQLNVQGGTASGWSAWLNGGYIGSFPGDPVSVSGALNLTFANATVSSGENVLLVLQDHSGHDELDAALNPRGILKAALTGSNSTFSSWRVAGNAGGEKNIDPVRGPIAEGGLHAERLGWHLPGFDDSKWASGSPADGVQGAGVAFYRTTVDLSKVVDKRGYDVALEFIIDATPGTNVRAQLYVNGYQYGKFVKQVGNQIAFPVPPGVLNVRGKNTIGLSVWSQSAAGAKLSVAWNVLGVYESAWDPAFDASYLQPGWKAERLLYA